MEKLLSVMAGKLLRLNFEIIAIKIGVIMEWR